jgi:YD repeat-containing protein
MQCDQKVSGIQIGFDFPGSWKPTLRTLALGVTTGKRLSDRSAIATSYAYDNRNRLTSKVTPFGTLSYTYDAASNLLTMKSSNSGGASDTYTYDQLNRKFGSQAPTSRR